MSDAATPETAATVPFTVPKRWSWSASLTVQIDAALSAADDSAKLRAALRIVLDLHAKWRRGEEGGSRADLRGAVLSRADLSRAVLSGADLRGAVLSRADLRGADLRGAVLSRADLSGGILSGADLSGADLRGAVLSRADLRGAVLSRADLRGADLSGADLRGAVLSRADLRGADLRGAVLSRADLSGGILSGADLSGADLRGGILRGGIKINMTPIQITNLRWPVTIWDAHLQIGCQFHRLSEWVAFDDRRILEMDGRAALEFWRTWKEPLLTMARAGGRSFEPAQEAAAAPAEPSEAEA